MISDLIYGKIESETVIRRGFNNMLSRKWIVLELLKKLQPDRPTDGSIGKIAYNVEGKDRKKIRTGRFLTRKLNLNSGFLSDKSIALIAGAINIELFPDVRIELVKGKAITDNYENAVGLASCMTYGNSCYTRLYEVNPNRFRMLTMFYMKDSARAIVHKLDNGRYFIDRVYASCKLLEDRMRLYAIENGWNYRTSSSAYNYDVSCSADDLVVSDLNYQDGEVPYMDTFINGCTCGAGLRISANGCCDYPLTMQDGSLEGRETCVNCNETIDGEVYSYGQDCYCQYCYDDIFSYCENCDETVYTDDMVEIVDIGKHVCEDCAKNDYTKCFDCGAYNRKDYCTIEDEYYCAECAEQYPACKECGEQFLDKDSLDDNGHCEDCRLISEKESEKGTVLAVDKDCNGQRRLDYES